MRLLISDANILIDIEIGGLVAPMFSLDYRFSVPDVLFYEELDEQHGYLIDMGLEVRELDERMVARVFDLAGQYKRPGRYDLFALVLAAEENCPLLTGDKDLKAAAESEHVEVRGTLWLVEEMVRAGKISVQIARNAYLRMQVHGRRLPWKQAEDRLALLDT
jgi:predicted nucleic acid-binding protein